MKKKLIYLSLCLLTAFNFYSCKEDDDIDAAYSKNSIEENKQNIEEEGLTFMDKLDGMKNLSGVYAAQDLSSLLSLDLGDNALKNNPVNNLLDPIANLGKDPMGLVALRATNDKYYDLLGMSAGVYTWNSAKSAFDFTAGSNEVVYKYPVGESTTNNGTLTISNLDYITTTNDSFPDNKFPTSFDVKLANGSTSLLTVKFRAEYNSDDLPSKVTTTLEFKEGYKFTQTFTNSEAKVVWDLAYSLDGDDIVAAHIETKGDFQFDNVVEVENSYDEEQLNNIINSANAWIQVGNLKLAGVIDYENWYKAYKDVSVSKIENTSSPEYNTKIAEVNNKYIKACLLYAKEKKAIAKTNFFAYESDPENYAGDYTTSLKFIFEDGSSMDDSFFETGFEDLTNAYNQLWSEIQTNYGISVETE